MLRILRVENEACFWSKIYRAALTLLGTTSTDRSSLSMDKWTDRAIVRHFKRRLEPVVVRIRDDLAMKLFEFRAWYNHVRPHQHLLGLTPAEAWAGRRKTFGNPKYFMAWQGLLVGWYFAPP